MDDMETIHIAFGLYDPKGTYSKYVGAAITSVFENTKNPVVVHILTDKELNETNRSKFIDLAALYHKKIELYDVDMCLSLPNLRGLNRVTQGTLYRLKLPDIIPEEIEKIIYLDADIIVNTDILNLWNENIANYAVLAVKDPRAEESAAGELEDRGLLVGESYFNAGVMVWNLKKIRSNYNIFSQAMDFFEKYGKFCKGFTDQHASNHIFLGDCRLLPSYYNTFTRYIRNHTSKTEELIYHFSDERPFMNMKSPVDLMFFQYLWKSPWGKEIKQISEYFRDGIIAREERIDIYRSVLKNSDGKKKVFWGAGSEYLSQIVSLFRIDDSRDYCVDSKCVSYGIDYVEKMPIFPIEHLKQDEKDSVYVIVCSRRFYDEIATELLSHGLVEGVGFVDGLLLLKEEEGVVYVR